MVRAEKEERRKDARAKAVSLLFLDDLLKLLDSRIRDSQRSPRIRFHWGLSSGNRGSGTDTRSCERRCEDELRFMSAYGGHLREKADRDDVDRERKM
jgi:hypothetical protein